MVGGAAAAWRVRDLHPLRAWLALAVAPETSAKDILSLVAEVRRRAQRPLKRRTWDRHQMSTLLDGGGRPLIESHTVCLDLANPETAAWCSSVEPVTVAERRLDDPVVKTSAWHLYQRIHAWDPVATGADAPTHFCSDLLEAATVDDPNGRPMAVAVAHEGDPPEAAYVGTLEAGPLETTTTASLVACLLDSCERLEIEADDGQGAHPALVLVLRTIPGAQWADPLTYIEVP